MNDFEANARRLYQPLGKFGAPLLRDGVSADSFTRAKVVYQIGVAQIRVDIVTYIDGVDFKAAWPRRVPGVMFGEPVNFISRADVPANKLASGRPAHREHIRLIEDSRE